MKKQRFLTLAEVLLIHQNQIEQYGGTYCLRDSGLLSSAIAMPESMFSGKYLHEDIFHMAAAYLFHICQNYPFIDGNKRVGIACCLVFLDINGIEITDENDDLYDMVIQITLGNLNKPEIAKMLKRISAL